MKRKTKKTAREQKNKKTAPAKPRRAPRHGWGTRRLFRAIKRAATRAEGWLPPAHNEYLLHLGRRPVAQIKVGKRFRKDMGDVAALARSINQQGLLQPIVIDPDGNLIAGERRLRAWQLSMFRAEPIPVHVVPLAAIVAGEWAENDPALRKDFKYSEAVAICEAIEAKLKPASRARQAAGGKTKQKVAGAPLRADEAAAGYTGKSRRSLDKAKAVVAAAKAEPEKYRKLAEDMDRSGRVDGPYRRLQTMQAAEQIRQEPPPAPGHGPYRAGVIDWPWAAEPDCDDSGRLARGYYPYPTMSIAQIVDYARTKVRPILASDCVVAMWIPNFHLVRGYHTAVLDALGLKGVTLRTWVKNTMGQGQVLRGKTESAIIATCGKPVITVGNLTTELTAPVNHKDHSRKPQKFYDDFEKLVAAPRYFSLFETADRGPKWDGHGDKAPAAAPVPAKPIKASVFRSGDRVDPQAIAVLSRVASAGAIPFGKSVHAILAWFKDGRFEFVDGPDFHPQKDVIGAIRILREKNAVMVAAYLDADGCSFVGSTMPYAKVRRLLIAWGKALSFSAASPSALRQPNTKQTKEAAPCAA